MTVYILLDRPYDNEVLGVYTTEELAIEARSHHPGSYYEQSEVDVIPIHPPDCYFWCVYFDTKTDKFSRIFPYSSFGNPEEQVRREINSDFVEVQLWSKNEKEAKELALEKYKFWKLAQNAPHDHDHLTEEENDAIFGTK